MGRILGIDFGQKRVGVAVTDPTKTIAYALETVSNHQIFDFLFAYMKNEEVECIVVGYPLRLNNMPSSAVQYIDPFLKKLSKQFPDIRIETMDERFTSKMAFDTLLRAGAKKKERQKKELIDKISASIILQSYLESIKK